MRVLFMRRDSLMKLSNDSGSLVNAAASLSPWRRALTPPLGGLAAGL